MSQWKEITLPEKEAVENLWKDLWQNETVINDKAEWLQLIITSIKKCWVKWSRNSRLTSPQWPNKWYWCKNLTSYWDQLSVSLKQQIHFDSTLPTWVTATHIVLLPKETNKYTTKSYSPIICFNVMYKLNSRCID